METRSQSRQQEEQFAQLAGMIQQLHTEQKEQLAQLTTTQQELIQQQDERWKDIEKRQGNADRIVAH